MYTQAYQLLKQRLAAIPIIQIVAPYFGQDKQGLLTVTPAVFVEFTPSNTERQGDIQRTLAMVKIHLVTTQMQLGDVRMRREDPADHFTLFDEVFKALNGLSGRLSDITGQEAKKGTQDDRLLFNSLVRKHITPPTGLNKQMRSTQQFQAIFYDHATEKQRRKIKPTLSLSEIKV